jgi:serine/threonine-protein kinase
MSVRVQPASDNASLPKPGDVIDGKYRVDHRIGSGAMSVVYQVTHRVTQKRFAMKWLLPELAGKSDLAERFLREARVGGRFDHPNVVEVYDVGASNGGFYMVLELLSGESLQQRIVRMELSWPDACRLLLPCMRAVAEAHHNGIVHRDLKPANIFVCAATKTAPERAKVLDFGLAKIARAPGEQSLLGTRSGVVMGTPHYMPLEQMRGEAVDRRADVYAFGVTLYQALSGRLPYRAATFGDLVLAMASEAPLPLERWAPRLPPGVGAAIGRALARHPADRYADLNAFVEALEPFVPANLGEESVRRGPAQMQTEPSLAPKTRVPRSSVPPPLPLAMKWNRRWWPLPAFALAALVASAGVLGHRRAQQAHPTATTAPAATTGTAPSAAFTTARSTRPPAQTQPPPTQTPHANVWPCDAGASPPSHSRTRPVDLAPRVPEPRYEGWILSTGEPYEARTAQTRELSGRLSERQIAEPVRARELHAQLIGAHSTPANSRERADGTPANSRERVDGTPANSRERVDNTPADLNASGESAHFWTRNRTEHTRATSSPRVGDGQPSARARRQWRQARVYVAHAPPPDPRAEELTAHDSAPSPRPPATPERPRPPRWLPLTTDEF